MDIPYHIVIMRIFFSALQWILSPEPQKAALPVPIVREVLSECAEFTPENKWRHARQRLMVSPDEISRIADLTKGQRENPLWAAVRDGRLTASRFGMLIKAINRGR